MSTFVLDLLQPCSPSGTFMVTAFANTLHHPLVSITDFIEDLVWRLRWNQIPLWTLVLFSKIPPHVSGPSSPSTCLPSTMTGTITTWPEPTLPPALGYMPPQKNKNLLINSKWMIYFSPPAYPSKNLANNSLNKERFLLGVHLLGGSC